MLKKVPDGGSLTCNKCFKKFSSGSHLSRHYKIHLGLKEEKCPVPECDCVFSRRDNMKCHYRSHLTRLGMDEEQINILLLNIPKRQKSISPYSIESSINSDSESFESGVNSAPPIHRNKSAPPLSETLIPDSPLRYLTPPLIFQDMNQFDCCNHPMCCIHGRKKSFLTGNYDPSGDLIDRIALPGRSLTPDSTWSFKL